MLVHGKMFASPKPRKEVPTYISTYTVPIVNNKVIKYDLLCIIFILFTIIIPSFVVIFATFAFGFTWFVKTDIR